MRRAFFVLALLAASTAAASQPAVFARSGFGVDVGGTLDDVGSGEAKLAGSGTLGLAAGGWAAGLHLDYAEGLGLFGSPAEKTVAGSLLAGREATAFEDRVTVRAWAGPSVVRAVTRGERLRDPDCMLFCASYGPSNDDTVLGATVRVAASAFPVRRLPVGLSVDAGMTLTRPVLAASGTVGLAVRLGG